MMTAFRVLAALKGLRGTWLDIFARNPERKLEVAMIGEYEKLLAEIAASLTPANHATAVSLAELPLDVKGYGYIKDENYKQAKAKEAALLRRLHMTCRNSRTKADHRGRRMNVFESPDFDHHEAVAFFDDKKTGLRAIIAIHSTALGPACGGTRMYPYATTDAALTDALRLSRGMSYKNAIADLPLGGGKACIIGNPATDKSDAKFAAYAEAINTLGGRYVTAMDVGILPPDMPVIARGTKYIAGYDQPGKAGGDSGPATALGVFGGLKAAVKHRLGVDTTKGLRVAIQGLGKVGMGVAKRLHAEGAKLIVADTNMAAVTRSGGKAWRRRRHARPDRDGGVRRALAQRAGRHPERSEHPAPACACNRGRRQQPARARPPRRHAARPRAFSTRRTTSSTVAASSASRRRSRTGATLRSNAACSASPTRSARFSCAPPRMANPRTSSPTAWPRSASRAAGRRRPRLQNKSAQLVSLVRRWGNTPVTPIRIR